MPKELTTEMVRGVFILDINWKIRWAYSSRNYINNFTWHHWKTQFWKLMSVVETVEHAASNSRSLV